MPFWSKTQTGHGITDNICSSSTGIFIQYSKDLNHMFRRGAQHCTWVTMTVRLLWNLDTQMTQLEALDSSENLQRLVCYCY